MRMCTLKILLLPPPPARRPLSPVHLHLLPLLPLLFPPLHLHLLHGFTLLILVFVSVRNQKRYQDKLISSSMRKSTHILLAMLLLILPHRDTVTRLVRFLFSFTSFSERCQPKSFEYKHFFPLSEKQHASSSSTLFSFSFFSSCFCLLSIHSPSFSPSVSQQQRVYILVRLRSRCLSSDLLLLLLSLPLSLLPPPLLLLLSVGRGTSVQDSSGCAAPSP